MWPSPRIRLNVQLVTTRRGSLAGFASHHCIVISTDVVVAPKEQLSYDLGCTHGLEMMVHTFKPLKYMTLWMATGLIFLSSGAPSFADSARARLTLGLSTLPLKVSGL